MQAKTVDIFMMIIAYTHIPCDGSSLPPCLVCETLQFNPNVWIFFKLQQFCRTLTQMDRQEEHKEGQGSMYWQCIKSLKITLTVTLIQTAWVKRLKQQCSFKCAIQKSRFKTTFGTAVSSQLFNTTLLYTISR